MISTNTSTPKRLSIQELKKKYESPASKTAKTPKPKSPELQKKFKVREMALLFNNKTCQSNTLETTSSPITQGTLPKPLPLPRTRYTKPKVPVPSPRSKSLAKLQKKPICFVAEDVFAKLTVKDKASLYTQFVNDMSRKNPKFTQHAEILEANIKKEVARGEVINEKQESVKHLLGELEARCVFPKQTISPDALERLNSVQRPSRRVPRALEAPVKSKEYEDLVEQKASHISILNITLQSDRSPVEEKRQRRARSLPRRQSDGGQLLKDLGLSEPCHKRNNDKMRTTLPIEAYAPPKKIRRTRAEHLAPQQFFQNQHLEILFYSWLKERHESEESEKVEIISRGSNVDEEDQKPKTTVDKLLEEAIAKLETVSEAKQIDSTAKATPEPNLKPQNQVKPAMSSESSTTSSAKQSNAEDSETGISNLEKNTSVGSLQETAEPNKDDSGLAKTTKALRKKKMRRTLSWRKDSSLVETNTISSTDNESEFEKEKSVNKKTNNKPQLFVDLTKVANDQQMVESGYMELDYTLTVNPVTSARKNSANCKPEDHFDTDMSGLGNGKKQANQLPRSLTDSFDQGFETGSNDIDSPIRQTRKSTLKRQQANQEQLTSDPKQKIDETSPSCFSTPVKNSGQQNLISAFNESAGSQQQPNVSPIALPLKNQRRRSVYDSESRRNSLAMQVIREDHPLEHHEMQSPRNLNKTEVFFNNVSTMDIIADMSSDDNQKSGSSSFWIKSGDFSISLDIHRNEKERLKLLYEIFSQRSCDTRDIHFGIDNHKFSVHDKQAEQNSVQRLPYIEGSSQYWFATGDMVMPFSGKLLAAEKVQRLFKFIKSSVEETGVLCFGVDDVEFSNVPELWSQAPKFSLESNYSMLVGLQSGNSNGLEGRSKYAWPHSKPVPVSDLDQSDIESDVYEEEENDSDRLSISPFGSKQFDLGFLGADDLMLSSDTFGKEFENESLDQLFEDKAIKEKTNPSSPASVADMLKVLHTQHERLNSVKDRLSAYHDNPSAASYEALDAKKGTPEYLQQLKNIVSDIGRIGSCDGFKSCSMEELERYMFFLSRYADICLNSCSSHMDKILDALMDQRQVFV